MINIETAGIRALEEKRALIVESVVQKPCCVRDVRPKAVAETRQFCEEFICVEAGVVPRDFQLLKPEWGNLVEVRSQVSRIQEISHSDGHGSPDLVGVCRPNPPLGGSNGVSAIREPCFGRTIEQAVPRQNNMGSRRHVKATLK